MSATVDKITYTPTPEQVARSRYLVSHTTAAVSEIAVQSLYQAVGVRWLPVSRAMRNCPVAVMKTARWWPWDLPSGGHQRRSVRCVALLSP